MAPITIAPRSSTAQSLSVNRNDESIKGQRINACSGVPLMAIVDCNSFYCSAERLFRPDLLHTPVVVLSNNDGCIISRSDEAKAVGIGMGGPYFLERPLIEKHGVTVFSSNYTLYGDISMRVMDTLRTLSPSVEVYSVDEAFLSLGHIEPAAIPAYSRHIKERVEQWTGISVSIGVAPTKTLAKMANNLAKKNKQATGCVQVLATQEQQRRALQQTRVNNIWGVGHAYASKLLGLGINSAWELQQMSEEWAHKHLGGVVGTRLIKELNGQPCIDMKNPLETKKMIATTRMFGDPVNDITSIKEAIATYTSRAAEKLRRQQCAASSISVFIVAKDQDHQSDFHRGVSSSAHTTLPNATADTQSLIKPAVDLVEQLFNNGTYYKKAGVLLGGLVPDNAIQSNLFMPAGKQQHRQLMDTIDNVNFSMRDDVVKFAASGTSRNWKMRQALRSPRYTSRWDELFEVS
ncbi:MAG TPA: Y-family DNA polymerase [Chitinophagaceae bacterium]|nr:Y-family DNA polymerase [Chitinophagaceae bacterium]